MPWTKLEPDINGVCRIAGTRPMITQPAKAASMKTYKATNPVIVIWNSMAISRSGSSALCGRPGSCLYGRGAKLRLMLVGVVFDFASVREGRLGDNFVVPIELD